MRHLYPSRADLSVRVLVKAVVGDAGTSRGIQTLTRELKHLRRDYSPSGSSSSPKKSRPATRLEMNLGCSAFVGLGLRHIHQCLLQLILQSPAGGDDS